MADVFASGPEGSVPTVVSGLPADFPGLTYEGQTPQGPTGTLRCTTTATAASPPGVYQITGCSGLSDAAKDFFTYNTSLDTAATADHPAVWHSSYMVVPASTCQTPISFTSGDWVRIDATRAVVRLRFSPLPSAPLVGSTINVSGVVPAGYNGTFTIMASTKSSLTYLLASDPGGPVDTRSGLPQGACPVITAVVNAAAEYGTPTVGSTWLEETEPDVTYSSSDGADPDQLAKLVTGDPTCSTTADATSPVGIYPLANCSGLSSPLYQIQYDYADSSYEVKPAGLTITGPTLSMTAGSPVPTLNPVYSGLVAGDTQPAKPATCSTTATSTSPPSVYPTSCFGASDDNYDIVYQDGTLTVTHPVVQANDHLGASVALSANGTTALVGAPGRNVNGKARAGVAELYVLSSGAQWTWKKELRLPGYAAGDAFGTSVALNADGTIALVGAPGRTVTGHSSAGVAEVFSNAGGGWAAVKQLSFGTQARVGDQFGFSVSLNGDGHAALVGAPFQFPFGTASLFRGPTWQTRTVYSAGAIGGRFGYSVAINRDKGHSDDASVLLIGAPNTSPNSGSGNAASGGSAYVFTRNANAFSFTKQLFLTPFLGAPVPYTQPADHLGWSVSLNAAGTEALVGVPDRELNLPVLVNSGPNAHGTYVSISSSSLTIKDQNGKSTPYTVNAETLFWDANGNHIQQPASYPANTSLQVWYDSSGVALAVNICCKLVTALPSLRQSAGAAEVFNKTSAGWAWGRELALGTTQAPCYLSSFQGATPDGDSPPESRFWGGVGCYMGDQPYGVGGDRLGYSVSLSGKGNLALVGAPFHTIGYGGVTRDGQSGAGAAELFELGSNSGWRTEMSLGMNADWGLGNPEYLASGVALVAPTWTTKPTCGKEHAGGPNGLSTALLGAPERSFDYLSQTGTAEFYNLQKTPTSKFIGRYCAWSSPPQEQTIVKQSTRKVPVNLPLAMVQMGDSVSAGEGTGYGYRRSNTCGVGDTLRWCPGPADAPPNGRGGSWLGPWKRCHDSKVAYSQDVVRDLNTDASFKPNGTRHGDALNLLNLACTGGAYETFGAHTGGGFTRYEEYEDGVRRPAEFGDWTNKTELNHSYFETSPNVVEMATGPNDVRFSDIIAWCTSWDGYGNLAGNLATASEITAGILAATVNPIGAAIFHTLAIAGFIIADEAHAHCQAGGHNSKFDDYWTPASNVGLHLKNMAESIRQRARADYQPLPKVIVLNYMFPVNPGPNDWCHDDWIRGFIGSTISGAYLYETFTEAQREYFETKFSDLNTHIHDDGFPSADASVDISSLSDGHQWCSDDGSPTADPNDNGPWSYAMSVISKKHQESKAPFHPTPCGQEHIADSAEAIVRDVLTPGKPQPIDDPDYFGDLATTITDIEDNGDGTVSVTLDPSTPITPLPSGSVITIALTSSYDGRYVVTASTATQLTLTGYADGGVISPPEDSGEADIPGQGDPLACNPYLP